MRIIRGRLKGRTIPLRRFVNDYLVINLQRPGAADREIPISPADVELTAAERRAIREHPQAARFLKRWEILEDGTLRRIPQTAGTPAGGILTQEGND